MSVQELIDRPQSRLRKTFKVIAWAVVIFYFLFGALIITTRWYLLPQIGKYKDDIAATLSEQTHSEVTIGSIEPSWNGLWPRVTLTDVRLEKPAPPQAKREILLLPRVEAEVAWRSVVGRVAFRSLRIEGASLSIRRVLPSVFDFGGFTVDFAKAANGDGTSDTIAWLMSQERIDVIDSSINYIDLTQPEPQNITASQLHATLERNHLTEFHFGLQAVMQDETDQSIDLRAQFKPAVFHPSSDWKTWSGEAYADIRSFDLEHAVATSPLPNFLKSGRGNVRLWAKFGDGRMHSITADIAANDLKVQFAGLPDFVLPRVSTRFSESYDGNKLLVALSNFRASEENESLGDSISLQAEFVPNAERNDTASAQIAVSHLSLEPLANIATRLPIPPQVANLLSQRRPAGSMDNTVLTWTGSWQTPDSWKLTSDLSNVSLASDGTPYSPGISQLSGHLETGPQEGQIAFDSRNVTVTLPGLFPADDTVLDNAKGTIGWRIAQQKIAALKFTNVALSNSDFSVVGNGSWTNTGDTGTADLSGTIERALPAQAWRYLPLFLSADARHWVAGGLRDGLTTNGRFVIKGDLSQFPWSQPAEQGEFLVEGDVQNGMLAYVPSDKLDPTGKPKPGDWPLLSDMVGHVIFHGASLTSTVTSAQSAGAQLTNGTVTIDDMGKDAPLLTVSGQTQCDFGLMASYLRTSPLKSILPEILVQAKGSGPAQMQLALQIPLAGPAPITLQGKLGLQGTKVEFGSPVPPMDAAKGEVTFTEKSVTSDKLQVQVLGAEATGTLHYTSSSGLTIKAQGEVEPAKLSWFLPPALEKLFAHTSGKTPATLQLGWNDKSGLTLQAESSLKGAKVDLPAPLAKPAAESWPTTFSITPSGPRHLASLYSLQVGSQIGMVVQIPQEKSRAPLIGAIAVGRNPRLPAQGVALEIAAPEVNYDRWKEILTPLLQDDTVSASQGLLSSLRVDIDRIISDDTSGFNNVRARGELQGDHWRIVTNADEFAGTLLYYPQRGTHGEVQAVFDLLHLPLPPHERINRVLEQSKRVHMPALRAMVKDLTLGDMKFGTFTIKADNTFDSHGQLWKIDALAIENPAGTVTATGQWWWHEDKEYTEIKALATLKNAGDFLSRLGYKDVIRNAHGTIQTEVNWQSTPWDPDTATLNGSMQVDLKNGSLQQVEPGAVGRLLSIISVQSLLRRMTLDFSDVFRQGLTFDTITWPMEVKSGVAKITNAKILGPHASMILEGNVNLPQDSVQGKVLVLPDVNAGGASLALAFVNPAVGIGTFLAQLILRDPLSKLFAVEYAITGSIDKPEITKVEVPRKGTPDRGR